MKTTAVFILSCLILAFLCDPSDSSHDVTWGARSLGDGILHTAIVSRRARFLKRARADYTFEQPNDGGFPKIITFINVTDHFGGNKGGYASLESGGPGHPNVKLNFISKGWRGFNFFVEVYGI